MNFAIIENDVVTNVIVADSAEIAAEVTGMEILETTGEPWLYWTRTDGVWLKPIEVVAEVETPVLEKVAVIEEPEVTTEPEVTE